MLTGLGILAVLLFIVFSPVKASLSADYHGLRGLGFLISLLGRVLTTCYAELRSQTNGLPSRTNVCTRRKRTCGPQGRCTGLDPERSLGSRKGLVAVHGAFWV